MLSPSAVASLSAAAPPPLLRSDGGGVLAPASAAATSRAWARERRYEEVAASPLVLAQASGSGESGPLDSLTERTEKGAPLSPPPLAASAVNEIGGRGLGGSCSAASAATGSGLPMARDDKTPTSPTWGGGDGEAAVSAVSADPLHRVRRAEGAGEAAAAAGGAGRSGTGGAGGRRVASERVRWEMAARMVWIIWERLKST